MHFTHLRKLVFLLLFVRIALYFRAASKSLVWNCCIELSAGVDSDQSFGPNALIACHCESLLRLHCSKARRKGHFVVHTDVDSSVLGSWPQVDRVFFFF